MRYFTIIAVALLAMLSSTEAAEKTPENDVVDRARHEGIVKCLLAIKYLSDYLIGDSKVGIHSFWNKNNPDKGMFTVVLERNYGDGESMLINLTVVPIASGACSASYEQIIYFSKSCTSLAKGVFEKYQYKDELNKNITVLQSENANVYLMPVVGGCIATKKEIFSDANAGAEK